MFLDDDLAFEKLKSIPGKDSIDFSFAGNLNGNTSLQEILSSFYLQFIEIKYYHNGGTFDQRVIAGKKDRIKFRRKKEELYNLNKAGDHSRRIFGIYGK